MRIAIASGKGGTGKTTVATHLAVLAARQGAFVHLVDCDVEAPNCHLFLEPDWRERHQAMTEVPHIDQGSCTLCGLCAEICQFNALACLPREIMVFPELCHACGGCQLLCPEGCISSDVRAIGEIATGTAFGFGITQGKLRIGEAMAPPLIRKVIAAAPEADLILLDSPPGTSCPVVCTVQESDYVVLVTEPTTFGLNDLKLAVEMVDHLDRPCGVVVNRAQPGETRITEFCAKNRIPLLAEIPDDRRVAEAYARGKLALDHVPGYAERLGRVLQEVLKEAGVPS